MINVKTKVKTALYCLHEFTCNIKVVYVGTFSVVILHCIFHRHLTSIQPVMLIYDLIECVCQVIKLVADANITDICSKRILNKTIDQNLYTWMWMFRSEHLCSQKGLTSYPSLHFSLNALTVIVLKQHRVGKKSSLHRFHNSPI